MDIGSANGYLVDCLTNWMKHSGLNLEFFGLEISRELTELSKKNFPHLKDHFFNGNVLDWIPQEKYDFVFTMILFGIPEQLREKYITRILEMYLKKGGRLIFEELEMGKTEEFLSRLNIKLSGWCIKRTNDMKGKGPWERRFIWIDNS